MTPGHATAVARPVVITGDEDLLDELLQVAAAADVEVQYADEAVSRQLWRSAALLLVDQRLISRLAAADLPRRERVFAVGTAELPEPDWPTCLQLGVAGAFRLGMHDERLIAELTRAVDQQSADGRSVAVVGAVGGLGASVLAAAVAGVGARRRDTVLLDLDPLGPGADLLLGVEEEPGARWESLAADAGRLPVEALLRALPTARVGAGSVGVLTHDRASPRPTGAATAGVVVRSLRTAATLVVADVGRAPDAAADEVLACADLTVLLVGADLRSCTAAGRMVRRLVEVGAEPALVVRGPSPGGLGPDEIAGVLGLPLLAVLRPQPRLATALEHGRLPLGRRDGLTRVAGTVLTAVLAGVA
jgi:secretion/DNA translocation related CpaE-like protein